MTRDAIHHGATQNCQTRTLTDLAKSADQQHAMAAREQRQTWVDITLAKNTDSQRKAVTLEMKTCYWVITQEVVNCKHKDSRAWISHFISTVERTPYIPPQ